MKISIITATFNSANTVLCCIQSLANQTHPAEHIIIDGASTDNTLEIVNKISPTSIIISEPDNGIYDAYNKGIALANSEVIGILNADDFYTSPDVLKMVAKVFENPDVQACYGDLEYISVSEPGNNGDKTDFLPFKVIRYWNSGHYTASSWYLGWMPPHPTFFVRRCVYERFGVFRLDMGSAADYELMLRFLLKNSLKTAYIPKVLVRMRIGGASNESLKARLKANAMDRRAWTVNYLKPLPWTFVCKPLRKLSQYVFLRPSDP